MFGFLRMSNEKYIQKLRRHGAVIGNNTVFFSPKNTVFDYGKAFLIKIGDCCKITSGVTIIAHDYSRSVARYKYKENIGGCAPIVIGNNCFIGINAVIMMGTSIGNNCIIGAGAVVKGTFPENSVIAGNPARVICSLDEYVTKRKSAVLREALLCVKHIYETSGKMPTVRQMGDGYAWLYLPHTVRTIEQYPFLLELAADDPKKIKQDFLDTSPMFESFDAFLTYAIEELRLK